MDQKRSDKMAIKEWGVETKRTTCTQSAGKFERGKRIIKEHATSSKETKLLENRITINRNEAKSAQNARSKKDSNKMIELLLLVWIYIFRFRFKGKRGEKTLGSEKISSRKSTEIMDIERPRERIKRTVNSARLNSPNEDPFRLTLGGRMDKRTKGTVGQLTLRHLANSLLDCSSDMQEYDSIEEVRSADDWEKFAEKWLKNVRNARAAVVGLMEDEEGRIGSITVGDLFNNVILVPVKFYMDDTLIKNSGTWIEKALPELHEVLRNTGVVKIMAGASLARFLLRPDEEEEALYPIVDPVKCGVDRTPDSFAYHLDNGEEVRRAGTGLKSLVWAYLGEQHGPYEEEENGIDLGRRTIQRWPHGMQEEYTEEQIVWSLEVIHAGRLCVLDYVLQVIREDEERAHCAHFGEVLSRIFKRKILRGEKNIQYWGVAAKTEKLVAKEERAKLFGKRGNGAKPERTGRREESSLKRDVKLETEAGKSSRREWVEQSRKTSDDVSDGRKAVRAGPLSEGNGERGVKSKEQGRGAETVNICPRASDSNDGDSKGNEQGSWRDGKNYAFRYGRPSPPDQRGSSESSGSTSRGAVGFNPRFEATPPERADCSRDIRHLLKITPEEEGSLAIIKVQLKRAGRLKNRDYLKKYDVCHDCAKPTHEDPAQCEFPEARKAWLKGRKYPGLTLPCLRCSEGDHISDTCPHINHVCGKCDQPGHFSAECQVLKPYRWFLMHLKYAHLGVCTRLNPSGVFGGAHGHKTAAFRKDPDLEQILFAKERSLRIMRTTTPIELIEWDHEDSTDGQDGTEPESGEDSKNISTATGGSDTEEKRKEVLGGITEDSEEKGKEQAKLREENKDDGRKTTNERPGKKASAGRITSQKRLEDATKETERTGGITDLNEKEEEGKRAKVLDPWFDLGEIEKEVSNEAQPTTTIVERESSAAEVLGTTEDQRIEAGATDDGEKREGLNEEALDPHVEQRRQRTTSVSRDSVRAAADSSTIDVGVTADASISTDKPLLGKAQGHGEQTLDCTEERTVEEETSGEGGERTEEGERATEGKGSNEAEELQDMADDDTITGDPIDEDFAELAQEYNELAQEYLDSDNGEQE